jgi:hypothetical protein
VNRNARFGIGRALPWQGPLGVVSALSVAPTWEVLRPFASLRFKLTLKRTHQKNFQAFFF